LKDKQGIQPEIHDPATGRSVEAKDAVMEFRHIAKAHKFTPVEKQAVAAVKAAKRRKTLVKKEKTKRVEDSSAHEVHYSLGFWPRPGKLLFTISTAIRHTFVFPDSVGGDSDYFVYLTSTNRSERGVEAHLAYYQQDPPEFWVYDWSIERETSRLALRLRFADFARYIFPIDFQGFHRHGMLVLTQTALVRGTTWTNSVHFGVFKANVLQSFDMVYANTYRLATNADQQPNLNGFWGPEVETMRRFTQRINPMGSREALFIQDGVPRPMTSSNTELQDDNNGIQLLYQNSKRDFLVN
jgi:hypothetical protein